MSEVFNFCPHCGSDKIEYKIPQEDNRHRNVCTHCNRCYYSNPKVIVGAVVLWQEKFLLCKRDIEPRRGFWTFPAGFLENGETLEEGACRETFEEAQASVEISHLLGVYSLVAMNQVHVTYLANMKTQEYSTTTESSEVQLFNVQEIPWDNLAFPVIKWALNAAANKKSSDCYCIDQRQTMLSLSESLKHEF